MKTLMNRAAFLLLAVLLLMNCILCASAESTGDDTIDFSQFTIDSSDPECIVVTLEENMDAVLTAEYAAGRTIQMVVPCDFDKAYVEYVDGDTLVASSLAEGKITFAVPGAGVYHILKGEASATPEAEFNGVVYTTLSEALAAAETAGGTVTLTADAQADDVKVSPGVTLDLNGKTLTANYIATVNTAKIIDSTSTKEQAGAGRLVADVNKVILQADNGIIPVYNGEAYVFVQFLSLMQQGSSNVGIKLHSLITSKTEAITDLLKDGSANNDITVAIELSWDDPAGDDRSAQIFEFKDSTVAAVFASKQANNGNAQDYGKMFAMTITGIEAAENLAAKLILISGTNVQMDLKTISLN